MTPTASSDSAFFSPTPFNWMEGGKLELPRGRDLHLRYRVVVHGGNTAEAGIAEQYRRFAEP